MTSRSKCVAILTVVTVTSVSKPKVEPDSMVEANATATRWYIPVVNQHQ